MTIRVTIRNEGGTGQVIRVSTVTNNTAQEPGAALAELAGGEEVTTYVTDLQSLRVDEGSNG